MSYSQSSVLTYIKRHALLDERSVNRLLVSAFIEICGMELPRAQFLSSYIVKQNDTESAFLRDICKRMKAEYGDRLDLESLVHYFEHVVSPADRIVTGAIYTPKKIRDAIITNCIGDKTIDELQTLRVADISCGCGGFLMDVARVIHSRTGKTYADIFQNNIFGIDIQEYAIERTKILLSLLALLDGEDNGFVFNLSCRDTLDFKDENWDNHYTRFDIIVGNPPYVCSRKLTKETREKLKHYEVCSSGHPDLYIPFIQIAIEMLADKGRMGLITMNTFLRSINGRSLRHFISSGDYFTKIIDFRGQQIFKSRNTYTCLLFIDKSAISGSIQYTVDEEVSLRNNPRYSIIKFGALDDEKGWWLNNFESTTAIETTGTQIKDYCPSRHGIATLNNKTYIFRPVDDDDSFFYLENDGVRFPIERTICRDVVNPNKLHSDTRFDELIEKLIFPYKVSDGHAIIIDPDDMRKDFPKTWEYLNYKKKTLLSRDNGDTKAYPQWYAYGRTQSLIMPRVKLFFPKFSNHPLHCIIHDNPQLMLYNGLAFVSDDLRRLRILKSIIESELFWEYIKANGKPYASGYYSLSGVDIKHFGIPYFTIEEEDELLSLKDKNEVETWLRRHYQLKEDPS